MLTLKSGNYKLADYELLAAVIGSWTDTPCKFEHWCCECEAEHACSDLIRLRKHLTTIIDSIYEAGEDK